MTCSGRNAFNRSSTVYSCALTDVHTENHYSKEMPTASDCKDINERKQKLMLSSGGNIHLQDPLVGHASPSSISYTSFDIRRCETCAPLKSQKSSRTQTVVLRLCATKQQILGQTRWAYFYSSTILSNAMFPLRFLPLWSIIIARLLLFSAAALFFSARHSTTHSRITKMLEFGIKLIIPVFKLSLRPRHADLW